MSELVLLEDFDGRKYCCRRKDFNKLLSNHPRLKSRLCELVTIYSSDNYVGFWQQLIDNGVFDDEVQELERAV